MKHLISFTFGSLGFLFCSAFGSFAFDNPLSIESLDRDLREQSMRSRMDRMEDQRWLDESRRRMEQDMFRMEMEEKMNRMQYIRPR
jgi:hypothetical protein